MNSYYCIVEQVLGIVSECSEGVLGNSCSGDLLVQSQRSRKVLERMSAWLEENALSVGAFNLGYKLLCRTCSPSSTLGRKLLRGTCTPSSASLPAHRALL